MTATSIPTNALEHTLAPGGTVAIETLDTEVRIRAVDGRTVRVRLANGDLATDFRVETAPDRLRIRAARRWTFGWRRVRGPLDVEVPRDAPVEIGTASGSVLGLDLVAGVRARTASGDVELAGVAGRIRADAVSGTIRVQALSDARLEVGSVSGRIDAVAVSASALRAHSTSGSMRVMAGLRGPGPFSLETISGAITLGTDTPVRLLASTVSGEVRSDVGGTDVASGDGRRVVALAGSGPDVSVRTISGEVRLVAWKGPDAGPGTGASAAPATEPATEPAGPAESAPPPGDPVTGVAPVAPGPASSKESKGPRAGVEEARLAILRALAGGEIGVAEAGRRIDALEDGSDA